MIRWAAVGGVVMAVALVVIFAAGHRWRDTAAAAARWDAHDSRRGGHCG